MAPVSEFKKIQIGTLTTEAPKIVTRHYETAAWSMEITAPAGTYPVYAYTRWSDGAPYIQMIGVDFTGPITGGFMRARAGGTFFGECEIKRRMGQTETVSETRHTSFEGTDLTDAVWPPGATIDTTKIVVAHTYEHRGTHYMVPTVHLDVYKAERFM